MHEKTPPATRLTHAFWRGLRLRCPRCGRGKLYCGWFRMNPRCRDCDFPIQRSGGFYLGSIYINYGLTALIVSLAYPILMFNQLVSDQILMPASLAFVILFPIWFFRHARSFWLAFDFLVDPDGDKEKAE